VAPGKGRSLNVGTSDRTLPDSVRHVIVDRDGVLNRELESGWLTDPGDWQWEEGSFEALRLLADHGVSVSVATNQSGIGRGVVDRDAVDRVHAWLADQLARADAPIVRIHVCPHAPDDGCACRKPRPGLILDAVDASGVDRRETLVIGDDVRDIEAARAAGVAAALVRTGKGLNAQTRVEGPLPVFDNLLEAVTALVGRPRPVPADR